MTTRHPYHLPRNLTGSYAVTATTEEWPLTNHPTLWWRKRSARSIRRKRQKLKGQGFKTFLVPVYIVTAP
jgi:hypothetical protein